MYWAKALSLPEMDMLDTTSGRVLDKLQAVFPDGVRLKNTELVVSLLILHRKSTFNDALGGQLSH